MKPNWLDNLVMKLFWRRWEKIFKANKQLFLVFKRELEDLQKQMYVERILVFAKNSDQFEIYCNEIGETPMVKYLYIHNADYLENLPLKDAVITIVKLNEWEKNPDYDAGIESLLKQLEKYIYLGLA